MKLQIVCALLLGVAMGTRGVVGDEEPEWWESDHWTTYGTLWNHFDCDTVFESERPIPSTETWVKMRKAYVNVVGSTKSSIGEPSEVDGFFAPIEARQSPGRGRGLFATEDIPRGQHLWSGNIQGATFDSGRDYKKFLASLSDEDACDVLQFSYVMIFSDGNENEDNARIMVDLDNGAIMNSIDHYHDPVDAGCRQEWNDRFRGGCDNNDYALRNIKKGDEILMNYETALFITDGWRWFGLADEYEEDDEEEDDAEEDDEYPRCHGSREFPDVGAFLGCEEFAEPLMGYSQLEWKKLRQTYHDIVGQNASSSISLPMEEDGFFVSVEKSESPRRLYAAQDIAKGHHIWTGTKQTAIFDNPTDYKTFLMSIPSDRACDILHFFGYVQTSGDENGESKENYLILVDLNDWVYANDASSDDKQASVGCLPEWNDQYLGGCKRNVYALRDIKEGDEILIEEGLDDAWDEFGLF
jgi:hypothetical protein